MADRRHRVVSSCVLRNVVVAIALVCAGQWTTSVWAQGARRNPAGKVYFADVSGGAQITTDNRIEDVAKRSIYRAEGIAVQTDKAGTGGAAASSYSTMVYSNGSAALLGEGTHVVVRKFEQEPFRASRTDLEVEPSISQTRAFLAHGRIALSTSKLVPGSVMTYETPHATILIRGREVVIEADDDETKIYVVDGECTVKAGNLDLAGQNVSAGQELVVRTSRAGEPRTVELTPIPPSAIAGLNQMLALASMARRKLYFEVAAPKTDLTLAATAPGAKTTSTPAETPSAAADSGAAAVFDAPVANPSSAAASMPVREIVPVPIVPKELPTQFTVSPAVVGPR